MVFEAKQHREKYETQFYRLQNAKQGKVDVFRDKIDRS